MEQQPEGGSKVQKGSDLWITVSMGKEPPRRTMENLVGVDAEQAYELLTSQGFKPLTRKEVSYVYEAGMVTRTDPTADTVLTEGQTVYIYVSTGPDVHEEKMPNVVGMDIELAKELMDQIGFTAVRYEEVESQKTKGEVVYQSVAKNTLTDVTSEVIIHYSEGPQETEAPETTEAPVTEPEETKEPVTIGVGFSLPVSDVDYVLDICLSGTTEAVVTKLIPAGTSSIAVNLTGSGTVYYDLYIDGVFEREDYVEFTDD